LLGLACAALLIVPVDAAGQAPERTDGYRNFGFSVGGFQRRLTGSGAYEEYVEATDSYQMLPSDGRALWGFSMGVYGWGQRTGLHFEFARSGDQFLYEERRALLGGGSTDTFVYIHYTTMGFRLRQAVLTRRLMASAGISWIEEERIRTSADVETQTFPADVFPMWSWGVDVRLRRSLMVGFSRDQTYDHTVEGLTDPIEGWSSTSLYLTFVW